MLYPTKNTLYQSISSNQNSYYQSYWQGNGTALLDSYSGASAAYSLRNLSSAYTGPLIRVRRSSDNLERDIYGTFRGDLDLAALTSFVGANSGFVTTWYDQSGSGRHATQATAGSQPRIVNAGAVETEGGKPAIVFDGTDDHLSNTTLTASPTQTVFYAKRGSTTQNGNSALLGFPSNLGVAALDIYYWNLTPFNYGFNTWTGDSWGYNSATSDFVNRTIEVALFKNGNPATSGVRLFVNNAEKILSQVRLTSIDRVMENGFRIGFGGDSSTLQTYDGNFQEICIWSSDYTTANRPEIQSNINNYYKIY
jgi:hypothetical protein